MALRHPLADGAAIRLTRRTRHACREAAATADLTVAAYVRKRMLDQVVESPTDDRMIFELQRLSRLCKHIHTATGGAYREATAAALRDVRSAIRAIREHASPRRMAIEQHDPPARTDDTRSTADFPEPLDVTIRIRFTRTDHDRLRAATARAGVTISAYARRRLRKHVVASATETAMIEQLRERGRELKRAHVASPNAHSDVTAAAIETVRAAIRAIREHAAARPVPAEPADES